MVCTWMVDLVLWTWSWMYRHRSYKVFIALFWWTFVPSDVRKKVWPGNATFRVHITTYYTPLKIHQIQTSTCTWQLDENWNKESRSLFLSKIISKLERHKELHLKTRNQHKKSTLKGGNNEHEKTTIQSPAKNGQQSRRQGWGLNIFYLS